MGTLRAEALRWRGADLQGAVRPTGLQGATPGIGEGAGGHSRVSLPRKHDNQAMGPLVGSEIHLGLPHLGPIREVAPLTLLPPPLSSSLPLFPSTPNSLVLPTPTLPSSRP